jgi:hypothetical protein
MSCGLNIMKSSIRLLSALLLAPLAALHAADIKNIESGAGTVELRSLN